MALAPLTKLLPATPTISWADTHHRPILSITELHVDGPPPAFQFAYDADGRPTLTTVETGENHLRTYDGAGQLTQVSWAGPSASATTLTYGYTAASQRQSLTRSNGPTDLFGYDAARQLDRAQLNATTPSLPSTPNQRYTFDAMGNRTSTVTSLELRLYSVPKDLGPKLKQISAYSHISMTVMVMNRDVFDSQAEFNLMLKCYTGPQLVLRCYRENIVSLFQSFQELSKDRLIAQKLLMTFE
jgi:YD repeat-containing protein